MQHIMRNYRLIFYRLYTWGMRRNGPQDGPQFSAIFALSLFAWLNLLSVGVWVSVFLGEPFSFLIEGSKIAAAALFLGIVVAHYVALVRGGRAQRIAEEFGDPDARGDQEGTGATLSYAICSLVVFFAGVLVAQ